MKGRDDVTSRVSTARRKVGFGDCDPAKIVYYPNYFDWFDRGSHQLFEEAEVSMKMLEETLGVLTPIVDVQCRFVSPARWEDEIDITSKVTRWGSRSFTVTHRVSQAATGDLVAEGTESRVCVRLVADKSGEIRACDIPGEVRVAFGVAAD